MNYLNKKLSIITCTYNSENFLESCFSSIENQGLGNDRYEHIIIDGYSTDNTDNIIRNYINRNFGKSIHYYQIKKKGVYNAMNFGIQQAHGEYVFFAHSDDILADKILGNYLDFIEQSGNKNFYFADRLKLINNKKSIPFSKIFYKFGLNKWIFAFTSHVLQTTVIEKKSNFYEIGFFNENFKIISDIIHFIEVGEYYKAYYFPKIVTIFRTHPGSLSSGSNFTEELAEWKKICIKYYPKYFFYLIFFIRIFFYFLGKLKSTIYK